MHSSLQVLLLCRSFVALLFLFVSFACSHVLVAMIRELVETQETINDVFLNKY